MTVTDGVAAVLVVAVPGAPGVVSAGGAPVGSGVEAAGEAPAAGSTARRWSGA